MMRQLLLAISLLVSVKIFGQSLPNDFTIGNSFEVFQKDSIRVYFSCTGKIIDKTCATYYRVGKMDGRFINVNGGFKDYDSKGNLFFKASMINNYLSGDAKYFHENGKLKEEGRYINDVRDGKWTYYYPDGKVEKIIDFINGEPLILEYYSRNGKAEVTNGNGRYRTEFSHVQECTPFEAWGEVSNGKRTGKWVFYNPGFHQKVSNEIYEEGKFIRGYSDNNKNDNYTEGPKIILTKFYANESLNLVSNGLGCPGNSGINFWEYNNESLQKAFYPDLQEKLNQYKLEVSDQWLMVGIQIDEKNVMSAVKVASSLNDTKLESFVFAAISDMKKWKSAKIGGKNISSDIFFTILVQDKNIVIVTHYIYLNKGK